MLLPHFGVPEMLIILVIIIVVFGVGRLADVGKSLGEGIREFKKAQHESLEDEKLAKKAAGKADKDA